MLFGRKFSPLGMATSLLAVADTAFAYVAVTGVHTGVNATTGARPPRRDILELQNDLPAWSLYIQAMIAFQGVKETDQLSFFQIAGIHGRPYIAWDGVAWNPDAPKIGYCTHDDVLFPTWHRPYLALFEQILAGYATTIAATYKTAAYTAAATNFRIPYWDWAAVPVLPPIVSSTTVTIQTPKGTSSVANPLLLYKFQTFPEKSTWFPSDSSVGTADQDLSKDPTTLRYPNKATKGTSQPAQVNDYLAGEGLMSMIYSMFTKATVYYNMATQVSPGPSLENPHGGVHVAVGGEYGHMTQLSYAAFDPIFWLHHANVDRLFTMWQAIYPDVFLEPESDLIGTYTIAAGDIDTSSSPLMPFYMADGVTSWTSDSARYTSAFGYSYASVPDAIITNATALAANVTATVNTLYNPGGVFTTKVKREQEREWSAACQVLSTAVGEKFVVQLYVGGGDAVASFYILPPPVADGGSRPALTYHNEFSLQKAIQSVDSGDVDSVVDYLTAKLSWTVSAINGTLFPNDQVAGLLISVQDEIVTLPTEDTQLPIYGAKTLHPEITEGKAGGATSS